jgi:hypothetical protein
MQKRVPCFPEKIAVDGTLIVKLIHTSRLALKVTTLLEILKGDFNKEVPTPSVAACNSLPL